MATLSDKTGMPVSIINQNTQSPIKAGTIISFAGATTPTGWLDCDGSLKNRADYPELYAQILDVWALCVNTATGVAHTPAPTGSQFRVPDLRNMYQRGVSSVPSVAPASVTTQLGIFQADRTALPTTPIVTGIESANHSHTDSGHTHPTWNINKDISASITGALQFVSDNTGKTGVTNNGFANLGNQTVNHTHSTATATGGDAETRPDSVGVKYIIKAFDESFNLAGFANATPTTNGLVAPRKGQTALTVTSTVAGWSTIRAIGVYYQDQDGNHRLKFNLAGFVTSGSYTGGTWTFTGVSFKNTADFYQPVVAFTNGIGVTSAPQGVANPGTATIAITHASASSTTRYSLSGDVELDSKPTWA